MNVSNHTTLGTQITLWSSSSLELTSLRSPSPLGVSILCYVTLIAASIPCWLSLYDFIVPNTSSLVSHHGQTLEIELKDWKNWRPKICFPMRLPATACISNAL